MRNTPEHRDRQTMPICSTCAFETERLSVKEWHALTPEDWCQHDLAAVVSAMLTPAVTQSLPESWQGSYDKERTLEWINERDEEGTTLLVVEKQSRLATGLMILFEIGNEVNIEVRLGYLLAEPAWGQGFASELVGGFVRWCQAQSAIWKLAGGVERDNPASRRVLEKNGFQPVPSTVSQDHSEQIFELILRPWHAATNRRQEIEPG